MIALSAANFATATSRIRGHPTMPTALIGLSLSVQMIPIMKRQKRSTRGSRRTPDYSATLCSQLAIIGCPEPVLEHRFHPVRRWRFDLAWPDKKIAVEIEGGAWIMGRHNRPRGYQADLCKYNAASVMGWTILRYSPAQVKSWSAAEEIAKVILGEPIIIG